MNSNLPINSKNSIFAKITNFFKTIFSKNKPTSKIEELKESVVYNDNSTFLNELKKKVIEKEGLLDNMSKENLIKEIEKNPEILDEMDLEKLKDIDKYCDEIIDNYKRKLNIA